MKLNSEDEDVFLSVLATFSRTGEHEVLSLNLHYAAVFTHRFISLLSHWTLSMVFVFWLTDVKLLVVVNVNMKLRVQFQNHKVTFQQNDSHPFSSWSQTSSNILIVCLKKLSSF